MLKLKYLILFISTAVSVYAGSPVDTGSLSLRIRNAGRESVIPWGKVTIKGPVSMYRIVDTDGQVLFLKIPSGSYLVKAEANGFQAKTMKMNLDFSEKQEAGEVVKLMPNPPVVFGKKKKPKKIPEPQLQVPPLHEKVPDEATVKAKNESAKSVRYDNKGVKFEQIPKSQPHKEIRTNNVKNKILSISIDYNDRDGLVAENPGGGMIVSGIVGVIALIASSVLMTLVVLRWKKTSSFSRMAFSGCGCTFAFICILAWILFIGFAIVMFDVSVKKAVEREKTEGGSRRQSLPVKNLGGD